MDDPEYIARRIRDDMVEIRDVVRRIEKRQEEDSAKINAMSQVMAVLFDSIRNAKEKTKDFSQELVGDLFQGAAKRLFNMLNKKNVNP